MYMNKFFATIATSAVAVVTVVSLSSCSFSEYEPPGSSKIEAVENAHGFTHEDATFVNGMIPHHEQAIKMSELAVAKSSNPQVLELAKSIIDSQSEEVKTLTVWKGESNDMPHMMGSSDMGMLGDEEMDVLSGSSGAEFDKLYLVGMIGHHEGAVEMAKVVSSTENADVKEFAGKVVSAQEAEIVKMKEILSSL